MASRSDEMAQPWARQSLVQLAPVWGRITDPQTVQTTTSVQSKHGFPKIQQQSAQRWCFALCKQPNHYTHHDELTCTVWSQNMTVLV